MGTGFPSRETKMFWNSIALMLVNTVNVLNITKLYTLNSYSANFYATYIILLKKPNQNTYLTSKKRKCLNALTLLKTKVLDYCQAFNFCPCSTPCACIHWSLLIIRFSFLVLSQKLKNLQVWHFRVCPWLLLKHKVYPPGSIQF